MPQIDVKITDLDNVPELRSDDLFLIANPMYQADGNPIANYPYESNSISGGALSASIREALRKGDLTIVGNWHFHTTRENVPTQDVKLGITDIVSGLRNDDWRSSLIDDTNTAGWYYNLSSSVLQQSNSDSLQSLSVTNNSIPNIDFVNRLAAVMYSDFKYQIKWMPSYKGELVYNTYATLDQMQQIYGTHTNWQRISLNKSVELTGTTIDVRLTNQKHLTSYVDEAQYANFTIDIPLTANEKHGTWDYITNSTTIRGITEIYNSLKEIDSVTFSLSVVGNTQHKGIFNISFYNGNERLASFPLNGNKEISAAESVSAVDDFGYEAATGQKANDQTKWEFVEEGSKPGSNVTYGGYDHWKNQTFDLSKKANSLNSFFRITGRTGFSTVTYPYRCRVYIVISKISGKTQSDLPDESDGIYAWKRIDSNQHYQWEAYTHSH